MQVTPAILPHSLEELTEKMEKVALITRQVHVDICDGIVGREVTWMPEGNEKLPYVDGVDYEFDLIVSDWRTVLPKVFTLRGKRAIVHIDSFTEKDCEDLANLCKEHEITLGLCVTNDVSVEEFTNLVRYIKKDYPTIFIQVMGIKKIGEQGQFFDDTCISRIGEIKRIFGDVLIQVDGAMQPKTTIPKVKEAGAEIVVVGSYLLRHDDMAQAYEEILAIE